jgi:hypothetical protein
LWERAFLREKRVEIDNDEAFRISTQTDFQPTSVKLCFLLLRFGDYSLRKTDLKLWGDFKEIEKTRNLLVHPSFEKQEPRVNSEVAEKALRVTKAVTMVLKDKIYNK